MLSSNLKIVEVNKLYFLSFSSRFVAILSSTFSIDDCIYPIFMFAIKFKVKNNKKTSKVTFIKFKIQTDS